MAGREPKYERKLDLSQLHYDGGFSYEKQGLAAKGILDYMSENMYISGDYRWRYLGLEVQIGFAKNGSVVTMSTLTKRDFTGKKLSWEKINIQVVNMNENDDGLVRILQDVAIDAAKKA